MHDIIQEFHTTMSVSDTLNYFRRILTSEMSKTKLYFLGLVKFWFEWGQVFVTLRVCNAFSFWVDQSAIVNYWSESSEKERDNPACWLPVLVTSDCWSAVDYDFVDMSRRKSFNLMKISPFVCVSEKTRRKQRHMTVNALKMGLISHSAHALSYCWTWNRCHWRLKGFLVFPHSQLKVLSSFHIQS